LSSDIGYSFFAGFFDALRMREQFETVIAERDGGLLGKDALAGGHGLIAPD